jgi:triacylglycerol lipase
MASPVEDRHPVLLVHGIWKTHTTFRRMARYLTERGFTVHGIDLTPNDGRAGIDELAAQLAAFIDATFPAGAPIDLVGFSMGGLVSRYYVQRLGGLARVRRFITISAPHHGTRWAYLRKLPGYLQMRPESDLLNDLNGDLVSLMKLDFTSIWTPLDLMITPAVSSRLGVGEEALVAAPLHALMLEDPRTFRAVAAALSAPLRFFGTTAA